MCRVVLLLGFIISFLSVSAQGLETDIFGSLIYVSQDRNYKAKLEKNIFDDLIFSDNKDNKISYDKKYLEQMFPGIHGSKAKQTQLMWSLLRENGQNSKYVAKHKIDIFDKVIIEDNRGYKLEQGKDIFGHENIREEFNGVKSSIKRNVHGYLEAKVGKDSASLKKNVFNKWIYEDSLGNKFEFASRTWDRLIEFYGSDNAVLKYLLEEYFY